jgi:hypothetical protein
MRDFWTFLKTDGGRATLGILSLVLAVTLYRLNKKSKKLVYQTISKTRVLTVRKGLAGRVEILFDGNPVQEVGLLQMKITNIGTETIKSSDFVRPIKFMLPQGQKVIDADFVQFDPPGLAPRLQRDDNSVTIEPLLLNANNSFQVKLLIANFNGIVAIDSRIEGVELKPGRLLGALEQAIVEMTTTVIFGVLFLAVARKGLPAIAAVVLLSLVFTVALVKWSKSFRYSASPPDDYK